MNNLQIYAAADPNGAGYIRGILGQTPNGRPLVTNNMQGYEFPKLMTPRGLMVNSLLRKDEWEELDSAIVMAARQRLNGIADLVGRGLTKSITTMGVLTSQWNVSSQMSAPTVSMSGASVTNQDSVDFNLDGRPIPVIHKEYTIDLRQLEADRLGGGGVDTTTAFEAGFVVAEKLEDILFNGDTLTFGGNTLYGYLTEPNTNTDTAANYGGGDWTTLANIVPTVEGMINAANTDNHYGPFGVYASSTQYNEAALKYFSETADTPLERILRMPMVDFVKPADQLADGTIVVTQLTPDVVDVAGIGVDGTMVNNLEWTSLDGLVTHFKAIAVFAPRVKSKYDGKSGVIVATGA